MGEHDSTFPVHPFRTRPLLNPLVRTPAPLHRFLPAATHAAPIIAMTLKQKLVGQKLVGQKLVGQIEVAGQPEGYGL